MRGEFNIVGGVAVYIQTEGFVGVRGYHIIQHSIGVNVVITSKNGARVIGLSPEK
jgi:hypothetical protein